MSLAGSTAAGVSRRGPLDAESREWLRCLAGTGRDARSAAEREHALARLHQLLLRAAHAELRRRSHPVRIEGRERDDLAHQAADDALLAITGKLDRFRGDSRFTTWAYKFVIFEVSAKLGRHYWRNPPVQVDGEAWERILQRAPAKVTSAGGMILSDRWPPQAPRSDHGLELRLCLPGARRRGQARRAAG